jgi:hypothetical protein
VIASFISDDSAIDVATTANNRERLLGSLGVAGEQLIRG